MLIIFYLFIITTITFESFIYDQNTTKIVFGSCVDFVRYDIDIFPAIIDYNPHLFVWLGDFAYIDDKILLFKSLLPDLDIVLYRFNSTKYHPSYQKLKSLTPIIGIWDDHDYGQNDGNKYNPHKYKIQQMYLDALDEPKDSIRRTQSGTYFSYKISKNVKMILLDTRFNKESWFEPTQDMLGIDQWNWLESELNDTTMELIFIASGTQIMPDDRFLPESWYVPSKQKLYHLLKKYKKRVILLSGDVHYGEIMKHPCSCEQIGYPLYEITSSGMTHYFGDGRIIKDKLANFAFPDTFSTKNDRFFFYNFGSIEITFDDNNIENSKIVIQIRDMNNSVQLEHIFYFKDLEIDNNEECNIKKKEDSPKCILEEPKQIRFLKNAVNKFFDFDYYLHSFIFMCAFIAIFVISMIIKFLAHLIFMIKKYFKKIFKFKNE